MEKRYWALRTISVIYKLVACIGFLVAVVDRAEALTTLNETISPANIANLPLASQVELYIDALFPTLLELFAFLSLFAFSEVFDLLISAEGIFRRIAALLERATPPAQRLSYPVSQDRTVAEAAIHRQDVPPI